MKLPAVILLCISFALSSCEKDPETVPAGRVRVLLTVNHHSTPIANATVFRKNGTLVFPGQDTTLYDERFVTDSQGYLVVDHIGSGYQSMVFYAKGFDPNWDSTQVTPVWGYQFTSFSTVSGESKDVMLTVPVSE
jgi:hypothetical protein